MAGGGRVLPPAWDTAPLSAVYSSTGPFVTALLDVSRDSENAEQEHELRAAVLTGASVAVSRSAAVGGVPVAALLRWHQDAVGDDTVDA
ncbi:MAG: hypothetical protein QOK15_3969 [Nocardioidaceae bacterium]|nr:hypothetical protein [Nocardioidaceae bacterium]